MRKIKLSLLQINLFLPCIQEYQSLHLPNVALASERLSLSIHVFLKLHVAACSSSQTPVVFSSSQVSPPARFLPRPPHAGCCVCPGRGWGGHASRAGAVARHSPLPCVLLEVGELAEGLLAVGTVVGLGPRVDTEVLSQVGGVGEALGAVRALVGLDGLRVHLRVDPAGEERKEGGEEEAVRYHGLSSLLGEMMLLEG